MNKLDQNYPVLAILCSEGPLDLDWPELDFARRLLLLAQERKIVAFLTTPSDLDFTNYSAIGYTILSDSEHTWYMQRFPFPQMIYNRVGILVKEEAHSKYSYLFSAFLPTTGNTHVFNCGWLNKWNVYQKLVEASELKVHIPVTEQFSLEKLAIFLKRYRKVYVKPQSGSYGRGIIRVTKWPDVYFCESHTKQGKKHSQLCSNLEEIVKLLLPEESYLVQQGVDLAALAGRVADFRVHLIKSGREGWEVAGAVGRRASLMGVVTHGWCGGSCEPAETLLAQLFLDQASDCFDSLIQAAVAIACYLDTQLPGTLAELGFDIGFDREGQLWLLEVNDRPNHLLLKLVDKQAEERLASLLLDYCWYLVAVDQC